MISMIYRGRQKTGPGIIYASLITSFCKNSSSILDTTELGALEKARPMVRQQGGSSRRDRSPDRSDAAITSFWETVTPNRLRTKAMMRESSRKL